MFLLKVLRRDPLASRLEKVKNLSAACNGLTVEQLFDNPEWQGRVTSLVVRED